MRREIFYEVTLALTLLGSFAIYCGMYEGDSELLPQDEGLRRRFLQRAQKTWQRLLFAQNRGF